MSRRPRIRNRHRVPAAAPGVASAPATSARLALPQLAASQLAAAAAGASTPEADRLAEAAQHRVDLARIESLYGSRGRPLVSLEAFDYAAPRSGRGRPGTAPQGGALGWMTRPMASASQVESTGGYQLATDVPHPSAILRDKSLPAHREGELYDHMLLTDTALASFRRKRSDAVLALPRAIHPGDATPEATEATELCRWALSRIPSWSIVLRHQLDSRSKGHAITEVVWDQVTRGPWAGAWVPVDLVDRPMWRFAWRYVDRQGRPVATSQPARSAQSAQSATARGQASGTVTPGSEPDPGTLRLHVRRPTAADPILAPAGSFLLLTHGTADDPRGAAILDEVYWTWWLKKNGLKFYAIFLEKWGQPTAKGRYPHRGGRGTPTDADRSTNQAAQAALLEALEAIQTNSAIAIPEGFDVDLLEATRSGDAGYERFVGLLDRYQALAYLGEVDTSGTAKGPGSFAKSEISNEVRLEKVELDAHDLGAHVRDQLFRPLVELNFGPDCPLPTFEVDTLDAGDRTARKDGIDRALAAKLAVPERYARLTWQVPAPRGTEAVLAQPEPPPAPVPPPPPPPDQDAPTDRDDNDQGDDVDTDQPSPASPDAPPAAKPATAEAAARAAVAEVVALSAAEIRGTAEPAAYAAVVELVEQSARENNAAAAAAAGDLMAQLAAISRRNRSFAAAQAAHPACPACAAAELLAVANGETSLPLATAVANLAELGDERTAIRPGGLLARGMRLAGLAMPTTPAQVELEEERDRTESDADLLAAAEQRQADLDTIAAAFAPLTIRHAANLRTLLEEAWDVGAVGEGSALSFVTARWDVLTHADQLAASLIHGLGLAARDLEADLGGAPLAPVLPPATGAIEVPAAAAPGAAPTGRPAFGAAGLSANPALTRARAAAPVAASAAPRTLHLADATAAQAATATTAAAARGFWATLLQVGRAILEQLADGWARREAATRTAITDVELLLDVSDLLTEAQATGIRRPDFVARLGDLFTARGLEPRSPWHAELIHHQGTRNANALLRYQQTVGNPAAARLIPYLQYLTLDDARVRPEHLLLHRRIFAVTHPIWRTIYPPWEFGCRCDVASINLARARRLGLTGLEPDGPPPTLDGQPLAPRPGYQTIGQLADDLASGAAPDTAPLDALRARAAATGNRDLIAAVDRVLATLLGQLGARP